MANVRRINLYATNTKRHCDKGKGGADSLPGFGCGDTVDVVLLKKKTNENMGKSNNSCNLV